MATHRISLAKIAGPLVTSLREEFLSWTLIPPDGVEPRWISGEDFLVKDQRAVERMTQILQLIQSNARLPPVIYFENLIDPGTVCPVLRVYVELHGRNARMRLARSDIVDCLLIQPRSWESVLEDLSDARVRHSYEDHPGPAEYELMITHMLHCAWSWETVLAKQALDRAMIVSSAVVAPGWLDDDVISNCTTLPGWYKNCISLPPS